MYTFRVTQTDLSTSVLVDQFLLVLVGLLALVRLWHDIVQPDELVSSEHIVERLSDETHRQNLDAEKQ